MAVNALGRAGVRDAALLRVLGADRQRSRPQVAAARHPWICEAPWDRFSVTALEMAHAWLRRPFGAEAFFFLRARDFIECPAWRCAAAPPLRR